MTRFLRCLVLLITLGNLTAWARPTFQYRSALKWCDETVRTDIPLDERVYILGPDKVTETYLSDGKPTQHDEEVRRVIRAQAYRTLGSLLKWVVSLEPGRAFTVSVYRAGTENSAPVFQEVVKDPATIAFHLQPRDVIQIEYLPMDGRPTATM